MDGITRVSYMSPWGVHFDFSESEWTAGLRYAGLSGMKAKVQAKTLQAIGQPGQITEATQIQAMEGAITLALAGENGGRLMQFTAGSVLHFLKPLSGRFLWKRAFTARYTPRSKRQRQYLLLNLTCSVSRWLIRLKSASSQMRGCGGQNG